MEQIHYRDRIKDLPLPFLVAMEKEHERLLETDLREEYRDEAQLSLIAIRAHIESKTRLRHGISD